MNTTTAAAVSAAQPVTLHINGEPVHTAAALDDTLLTVLRDRLQLTAAKRGCNQGVCGACTVRVDGVPMRACLSLAQHCASSEVHTLEGLGDDRRMRALQVAFAAHGAFQCGFCTPGMLVSAHALLEHDTHPDNAAVRRAMSGNLCRCTGYGAIIDAVLAAAAALREGAAA